MKIYIKKISVSVIFQKVIIYTSQISRNLDNIIFRKRLLNKIININLRDYSLPLVLYLYL